MSEVKFDPQNIKIKIGDFEISGFVGESRVSFTPEKVTHKQSLKINFETDFILSNQDLHEMAVRVTSIMKSAIDDFRDIEEGRAQRIEFEGEPVK